MRIAVTYTGNEEKQQKYFKWLQRIHPSAELVTLSYGTQNAEELSRCDGLVLTGGVDIDPVLYGQPVNELTKDVDRKRDDFEFSLIEKSLKEKKPILGICRGMQTANVFFGGSLFQDLPLYGFQNHAGEKKSPGVEHGVNVRQGSLIADIVNVESGIVNSYHHQGVDRVAGDLLVGGFSPDNVPESMEWKEKAGKPFLLLVQWHPERISERNNPFVDAIGIRFINEMKNSTT